MLKLDTRHVAAAKSASVPADLIPLMQNAMKLEHATVPIYLTAMMSFKPGTNQDISRIIHSVVIEEMLHMSIACNIINALRGCPAVNDPDFIPTYPGPLPMGIGGKTFGLNPFSLDVVKDVFMEIEEPEDPLNFPAKLAATAGDSTPPYSTIGEFYDSVKAKILDIIPGKMPGNPAKQLTSIFPPDQLFPIQTGEDAARAIDIIVEQGEGTTISPLDPEGDLAHYYRFAEIYHGKSLVPDSTAPHGFSYSGSPIPFDPTGVYPLYPNTHLADLPVGSEAYNAAVQFSQAYTRLLNALNETFNGNPGCIQTAMGLMFDVKLSGDLLAAMPFPNKAGFNVGPVFRYTPVINA